MHIWIVEYHNGVEWFPDYDSSMNHTRSQARGDMAIIKDGLAFPEELKFRVSKYERRDSVAKTKSKPKKSDKKMPMKKGKMC